MLKIGLFGYGKMGRAIESVALAQGGCEIVWRIGSADVDKVTPALLREADVIIEFTKPHVAFDNVMTCLRAGVPVVCGTTGWHAQLPAAQAFAQASGGGLLWSSNFSIGVNIFFSVNRMLAKMMGQHPNYEPTMEETHHIHKLDAPSGTAVTLAQDILQSIKTKTHWGLDPLLSNEEQLTITAIRTGEVPGTHIVRWNSAVDEIEIKHTAHSRQGFAVGAVVAARWMVGKKGVFSMEDVVG